MNLLDRYGVKEVADVVIYELDEFGEIGNPVLFLDTLKVCEISVAEEEVKYYGGMGNNLIIDWSYINKINVKIEDALFSMKSLAVLCDGQLSTDKKKIIKTEKFRATSTYPPIRNGEEEEWNDVVITTIIDGKEVTEQQKTSWNNKFTSIDGRVYNKLYPRFFDSKGNEVEAFTVGEIYYCTYYIKDNVFSVSLSNTSFPKYYCIVGETYIRSEKNNSDFPFYFIIPKAKLNTNLNLKLSSEDVSIFNFNFSVMKHRDHNLIELIQMNAEEIVDDYSNVDYYAYLSKMLLNKNNPNIEIEDLENTILE